MVWTDDEIAAYKPLDYPPLNFLYQNWEISRYNPEERARFLAEDVLNLGMTDHDLLMRVAAESGKAEALRLLEEMVVAGHEAKIRDVAEKIGVPLEID